MSPTQAPGTPAAHRAGPVTERQASLCAVAWRASCPTAFLADHRAREAGRLACPNRCFVDFARREIAPSVAQRTPGGRQTAVPPPPPFAVEAPERPIRAEAPGARRLSGEHSGHREAREATARRSNVRQRHVHGRVGRNLGQFPACASASARPPELWPSGVLAPTYPPGRLRTLCGEPWKSLVRGVGSGRHPRRSPTTLLSP